MTRCLILPLSRIWSLSDTLAEQEEVGLIDHHVALGSVGNTLSQYCLTAWNHVRWHVWPWVLEYRWKLSFDIPLVHTDYIFSFSCPQTATLLFSTHKCEHFFCPGGPKKSLWGNTELTPQFCHILPMTDWGRSGRRHVWNINHSLFWQLRQNLGSLSLVQLSPLISYCPRECLSYLMTDYQTVCH